MTDSNNLAFVITVAPNNKSLFPVIQINFYSLQETYETKEGFKDIELIKNNNNLVWKKRKKLNQGNYANKNYHYSKKCNNTRCACCDYIKEGNSDILKTPGDIFLLNEKMTCNSSNLVVIFPTCNEGDWRYWRKENKCSR